MKKKKILISLGSIILLLSVFSSSILAESKKQLEELVMEHEIKIASLEQTVNNLKSNTGETISPEVKQALLYDISKSMNTEFYINGEVVHINVVNYDIKEKDGKVFLQFFTEGDNGWSGTNGYWDGVGLSFAKSCINKYSSIAKLYDVNVHFEFYENGEKIDFTKYVIE